ncbi:MAG: glycosyltransferase family 4 protein [Candidatus Hydrogenedentes bacterium]|nr:glycosyltransferase family 4 protein [Candidatus Hydrogenedentota bacterium]
MTSPEKIPVIIAVGDFASGVTSWALRLREAFEAHPRYRILLMNCTDTRNRIADFDLHAASARRARELLAAFDTAIVVPNFVWDLIPICVEINATGKQLRCIGYCRADSEPEYYAPLRWYAPAFAQFATVSPACTRALAERLDRDPASIHTLPAGVHVPEMLDRAWQTAPIRLAYGGRIVQEQKRVMDFVPLVAALEARGVDFRFDIAGVGPQRDELERSIAGVDTAGRVRFHPRRKPPEMPAFWADHDVFVQVSDFEGTSNSMLESMAAGVVPVLTRTASGVDGIVAHGENGFLAPPGDMDALADAIAQLASDPARLARMGAAAHAAVRPCAMPRHVELFAAMLNAALEAPPAAWPEGRPLAPPEPFHGVRLAPDHAVPGKRRIAILFPSPLRGGAEDYALAVAAGAVRAGHDVHAACSKRTALRDLTRDFFRAGVFHHTLEICDVGPKSGQALFYKRFTRTIRLLRRLKPDAALYMLCGMQYGFLSLLACAVAKTPTLVVFQLVRDDIRIPPRRRAIYRWMRARGQRYVAVSAENRDRLARAFGMPPDEILVIPNGVRIDRFAFDDEQRAGARARVREALNLPPDAVLCLTVGRLSHQKGHDILVPAIPHVVARFPGVHFLWAGDGPREKKLRALLVTYGASPHVTLLGRRDDMPELLNACDLLVHPARFEGQPFSVLEAMAAGLPVVSAAASGIPEIIAHEVHGLLCRPDDIGALRDAILDALADPEAMARRADAARERVAEFSEDAMIAQTLRALDALADGP